MKIFYGKLYGKVCYGDFRGGGGAFRKNICSHMLIISYGCITIFRDRQRSKKHKVFQEKRTVLEQSIDAGPAELTGTKIIFGPIGRDTSLRGVDGQR